MKPETVGIIQILTASLLFSLDPILVRIGASFGTYNLVFFRMLIAVIFLYLSFMFIKKTLMPLKTEIGKMILFGVLHPLIIIGYFIGIKYLSVATAVFLLYSSSIWMIVFSYFILKEKITLQTWIALLVSVIGVIFILDPKNISVGNNLIGSIAVLLGGIGFGLVYVLSKTFKTYDKASLTFWQNMIAIPLTLPLVFIQKPVFTATNIWIIILLGTIGTTIPFILIFKGLDKVKGQTGGVLILFDMIFPILLAFFIFREIPGIFSIVGGVLIIAGTLIATLNFGEQAVEG